MKRKLAASLTATPLKQGDLDGLCGIYAIINSVRLLCAEVSRELLARLFKGLVRALKRVLDKPLVTVWAGMEWRTLLFLVDHCIAYVRRTVGIRLRATLPPKFVRRAASVDRMWSELDKGLSRNRVAILCIEGAISHWTVVHAVTSETLRLFDSSGRHILRRSYCSVSGQRKRFQLDPKTIVFIERIS